MFVFYLPAAEGMEHLVRDDPKRTFVLIRYNSINLDVCQEEKYNCDNSERSSKHRVCVPQTQNELVRASLKPLLQILRPAHLSNVSDSACRVK